MKIIKINFIKVLSYLIVLFIPVIATCQYFFDIDMFLSENNLKHTPVIKNLRFIELDFEEGSEANFHNTINNRDIDFDLFNY